VNWLLIQKIYPANPLSSLFDDIRLSLNGTTVEGGYHLYPYKAIMTSLLQLNAEAKRTELRAAGFQEDKAVRGRWFASSKPLELMGRLFLDLFSRTNICYPQWT
jgi:hypothetical protein